MCFCLAVPEARRHTGAFETSSVGFVRHVSAEPVSQAGVSVNVLQHAEQYLFLIKSNNSGIRWVSL